MSKDGKLANFYFPREIIHSESFWELSGTATRVLLVFWTKRQVRNEGSRSNPEYVTVNNGDITFTYREAEQKYGIAKSTFQRAIDQLVDVGFIDVATPGSGLRRGATHYGISQRWRNYGTPDFVQKSRPRDQRGVGFRKGHQPYGAAKGGHTND